MGKIALIGDIHSNYEALEAVLKDIDQYNVEDIISLGDNIGYGPNPILVLRKLYERQIFSIEGNHDNAILDQKAFMDSGAHGPALKAIEWTRDQLSLEINKDPSFEDIASCYFGTPPFTQLPDDPISILTHGRPGNNKVRFDYLIEPEDFLLPTRYMVKKNLRIAFFAHTHQQGFWEVDENGVSVLDLDYESPMTFTKKELENCILFINPGAVGQPRDNNHNSAYMIYEYLEDRYNFIFRRVAYDYETTMKKIYNIPELDDRLGDRLYFGN